MNDEEIEIALSMLEVRKELMADVGSSDDYSYKKIGEKIGFSAETIRQLDKRDMSDCARKERQLAQFRSASLLTESEELTAAGWIICHDLLRLNTSVETFLAFLRIR
jgi:hypothetical protein